MQTTDKSQIREKGKVMVLGTGSSVGKSIITAGLCRVFAREGHSTAPFKAQNMALNSFITTKGLEMGRAQVVQAEAAGIEPDADMNPILLKPTGDKKSQVIVQGKVYANLSATEYYEQKELFKEKVLDSYEKLSERFDVIIMEGAGSPAEINLMDKDIVNMGMAEMADAPVILVGDIDRGGVFASLYGTVMLMPEHLKRRIKGFIINKFRGDLSILEPGLKMIEDLTGIPVLGVVPYTNINIEDEDSLTERFARLKGGDASVKVAVLRLPHVSNFTDIHVLETLDDVAIKYVFPGDSLGDADLLIIPGSKNTIDDLTAIRNSDLEEQIIRFSKAGGHILGICGGFQILGRSIRDPHGTESDMPEVNGLGLLDVDTVFETVKTTTQVEAEVAGLTFAEGMPVKGYEIHMGISTVDSDLKPFSIIRTSLGEKESRHDGAVSKNGRIMGTYLHGILDNYGFSCGLINQIRTAKGLEEMRSKYGSFSEFKEEQYNLLADVLTETLDIEAIRGIVCGTR